MSRPAPDLQLNLNNPNVFFVPSSHLSFRVGRPFGLHYHFGSLGQLQHGVAYADAYLEHISIKDIKAPAKE